MRRLVAYFAEQSLIVNIISVALLIAGIMFIVTAKREAFPRVDFDWVIINTVYPGATAEDVEKHISIPIEKEMREVDNIEEIHATSIEARSTIAIKLDPDISNKDKTINDIKNALDKVTDLPEDSEKPEVLELNTAMTPVMEIALINKKGISGDADEFELRRHAKILEDRLLEISGVGKVDKKGYRDREMIVEVNPGRLDIYHVAINEVVQALSKKNLNFPGGIIKNKDGEVLIRTIGEVQSTSDLEKVLVRANDMGNWVRVSDIANVKDSFEEETIINKTKGEKSIALTVIKKESADIIEVVEKIEKEIQRFKKILPAEYEFSIYNDMSYYVKRRLNVLVSNGIVGFVLVALCLFFTLGWRIAIVTALGIPFAFFGTFIWMSAADVSVNLMSMFGLIMVLGMLVDDAIVVAENIYRLLEEGTPLKEAVVRGTAEVMTPVLGTVLTTIAAFAPLMFMKGIMGKFMWTLPAVVIVALTASWLECMFILPSHIADMERFNKKHNTPKTDHDGRFLRQFKKRYRLMLGAVLRHRYLFSILLFFFFIGTLVFAKFFVKLILFPPGGIETLTIKAEAPNGTSVQDMSRLLGNIEKSVMQLPKSELDTFTTKSGIIQENPTDPYAKRGAHYGIIMVYLTPFNKRDRKAEDILDTVRDKSKPYASQFTKLEFSYVKTGPPVGKPVSVAIKGDDFAVMKKISAEYIGYLKTIKGLKDIQDDSEEVKAELRVIVNEKTAAMTGITVFDVASTVRSCFEGAVATKIKKTDEEIDIRVIFPENLRKNLDSVKKINIANRMGNLIPLSAVARFEPNQGISVIKRKDWRRVVNVTAEIDEDARGVTSVAVNNILTKKFDHIEERYPGYTVSYEGEFKDTGESMSSLAKSFLVAALVIYIILVSIFRSLAHPLIIMGVVPLTLIAVIWIFFFHGRPLSFLGIMGVVGLTGVVVNDSIVMVDFIKKARSEGHSPYEASLLAGETRLRPIFLTSVTTFFGLIPTAYGIGGYDPFLVPMALSLSWGLAFGTLITLFGTPVLYNIFADVRKFLFHKTGEQLRTEFPPSTIEEIETEIEETVREDVICEVRERMSDEIRKTVKEEIQKELQSRDKKRPRRKY